MESLFCASARAVCTAVSRWGEKTGWMQVCPRPFSGANQSGSVFSTLKTEKSEHIFDGEIHILWVLKSVICTVYRDELDQVVI